MKFVVRMKWVEIRNEWHMETPSGELLQEFFNCVSLPTVFENLDRNKPKLYTIDVNLLNKKE